MALLVADTGKLQGNQIGMHSYKKTEIVIYGY